MRSDDQSLIVRVPKGEKPVSNAVVQGTELPNLGIFQFLENFLVDSVHTLAYVVDDFCSLPWAEDFQETLSLLPYRLFEIWAFVPCFVFLWAKVVKSL